MDDALLATLPGPGLPDDVLDLGETARRGGEVLEALERAVAGLNPSDRALLRMRYWEGFPASRMAVMAGRDAGRINGRLHRIRRELRRRLHGEGIGAADAARLLRRLESGSAGAAWG